MNILVYDVAAENGGAVSILKQFYEEHKKDTNNHYFYLLSKVSLDDTENITVINVPEVKKGWLQRILFDNFGAKKYIKQYKIDKVLSLQNNVLPCFKGEQTVYVHNALPFCEYRFSFKEDKFLWVYQNLIGFLIKRSIAKANHVIVQTEWMKKEILKRVKTQADKIKVSFPDVNLLPGYEYKEQEEKIFFYPANPSKFKNHRVILDACLKLKEQGINNYSVVFTLNGDETPEIKYIHDKAKEESLDFQWVGALNREQVFEWYTRSILLFPSYIVMCRG